MTVLKKLFLLAPLLVLCVVISAQPASADTILTFKNITANNATDASDGEDQLRVAVIDAGSNQVSFKFYWEGDAAMSITDIYFDDGTLLGIATITDSDGTGNAVDFSQGANPADLPGGNDVTPVPFVATAAFNVSSDPPPTPRGVNNEGEYVIITFNLINGKTYADTLAALAMTPTGQDDGSLRIGLKVQGFLGEGSESFINEPPEGEGPPDEVPEPVTFVLLGTGLLGLAAVRRKN